MARGSASRCRRAFLIQTPTTGLGASTAVGVWRLLDLFTDLELPISVLLNSELYDHSPEVVAAFRARGDEIVGHGRTNSEHQNDFDEAGEAALIREATETIARHEGRPPAGWLSPGVNPSDVTPDLLQEAGYTYILDWPMDDQPVWIKTRRGRFFPNRLVPRIVACLSVVWTASALCGPLIGGAFATAGLWRFAFWTFALQGLLLAVAVRPLMARAQADAALPARRIPVVRLMLVAGAILAISFSGAVTSTTVAVVLALAGCGCLWLFVARDSAAGSARLLPERATDLDHPVGCGIAMTFVLSLSMMSFIVYGPILLIRLYGLTPLEAGLVIVTESLGWGAGALFLSGLAPSQEGRLIRIGGVLVTAGLAAQAWFMPWGPLWLIVAVAFFGTAGFGMMWGYIIKRVVAHAGHEDRDRAGSLLPSAQQTGFALGAALAGIIANGLGFEQMTHFEEFRTAAFWLFAGFVPPALLGCLIAWRFGHSIQ